MWSFALLIILPWITQGENEDTYQYQDYQPGIADLGQQAWYPGESQWSPIQPQWPQNQPQWPQKQPQSRNPEWYIPPGSIPEEFAAEIANDVKVPIQPPLSQPQPQWPQEQPQWPQEQPQWPQEQPQWPQEQPQWPQEQPQWPQEQPQWPHEQPQWPQEQPQWPQEQPQWPLEQPQWPQEQPQWPQEQPQWPLEQSQWPQEQWPQGQPQVPSQSQLSQPPIGQPWTGYSDAQSGCYYDHDCPQPQYVDGMWHDYNSFYYGPCFGITWDESGCGGVEVPFCDPNTCTQSCIQFLNYDKGICHNQECYCRKSEATPKPPTPSPDWTYDNQAEWAQKYPNCGKSPQSPVDLSLNLLRSLNRKIEYVNYEVPVELIVSNTGHGVRIYVQSKAENMPSLRLTGVNHQNSNWDGNFHLGHIDLHWNTSEHSRDKAKADLEMQLHHFDLSYDTYEEASEHPGATKSIGFLFKIHPNETDLCHQISMAAKRITKPGTEVKIPEGQHLNFVNKKLANLDYFVYKGSQTQPPCLESHWLVSNVTLKITEDQIKTLQSLLDEQNKPMTMNVRNIQANTS